MNGIHDVGGMDGLGPIDVEEDEPVFHDEWEGWTYSLFVASLGNRVFNLDEFRYSIERMDPEEYLEASYYERWLTGIERLLVEKDVFTREEVDARMDALESGEAEISDRTDSDLFGELVAGIQATFAVERDPQPTQFEVGDRVRVRNAHPEGHTRCPRYVRRAEGVVEAVRGTFVLPDSHAHGGEDADPVYNVRFDARELWGSDRTDRNHVHIDMWERYLEPITNE